jgi:predicted Holliday junction resolvase-like endonuclease
MGTFVVWFENEEKKLLDGLQHELANLRGAVRVMEARLADELGYITREMMHEWAKDKPEVLKRLEEMERHAKDEGEKLAERVDEKVVDAAEEAVKREAAKPGIEGEVAKVVEPAVEAVDKAADEIVEHKAD